MKIVYILLVHVNYEQTMRLYNRLNHEGASFVIHIEASKSNYSEPQYFNRIYSSLKDQDNCYFAERTRVLWGDFGMVQGVNNAIKKICEKQLDYDYAIFLSGQDYPIKPHAALCKMLEKHPGKQFMEYTPYSEVPDVFRERVETYHFWIRKRHFWYPHENKKLITILFDLLCSPFIKKQQVLPHEFVPYKGSFWWNLTKDCIEYLNEFNQTQTGLDLISFFKHTYHPAESYFPTVLMNSKYKDYIVNDDLRYVSWPDDSGHPAFLTVQDFDQIKNSNSFFARKINTQVDPLLLDMIDEQLLSV